MTRESQGDIDWATSAKTDSTPIIRLGMWSIGVMFITFLAWGSLFDLSSAVITSGTLVSEGRNKLIQHPVGGRIMSIKVAEGDHVELGEVLMELDPSRAEADLSKIDARRASLAALKTRLDAERKGGSGRLFQRPDFKLRSAPLRGASLPIKPVMMANLRGALRNPAAIAPISFETTASIARTPESDERPDELVESQRDAYRSGRKLLSKEVAGLKKKAQTLAHQKSGIDARIASQMKLIDMTRKEIARLEPLAAEGYVARNRLDDDRRSVLEMEGNIAALKLDVASHINQIAEVNVQIEKARVAASDEAAREYARIVAELAEVNDQRRAAMEVITSLNVRAPVSGQLASLEITTTGGVFGAGDVVGQIVPDGAPLLVEARTAPSDIKYVQPGQFAEIAITAFDRRLDDTFRGEVVYVSADAQKDEKTGDQFFITRLKLLPGQGAQGANLSDLQAGMQSEVYINTGSRTFLAYLGKPLLDSFKRAFRER